MTVIGRVLVVDDDDAVRRAYARALRAAGHVVDEASDSTSAIVLLGATAHEPYDVVVCDVCLPGQSGLTVLRTARVIDDAIPVILVSGMPDIADAQDALAGGALLYLTKPVAIDELLGEVQRAIGLRELARLDAAADALSRKGLT